MNVVDFMNKQADMLACSPAASNVAESSSIRSGLNVDIGIYARSGFSSEQMEIIEMGLRKGLDVNIYAKLEFSASTMRMISEALQEGYDIADYVNEGYSVDQLKAIIYGCKSGVKTFIFDDKEFDKVQMWHIIKGVTECINVDGYAKPGFTAEQMMAIRFNLLCKRNPDWSFESETFMAWYYYDTERRQREIGLSECEIDQLERQKVALKELGLVR